MEFPPLPSNKDRRTPQSDHPSMHGGVPHPRRRFPADHDGRRPHGNRIRRPHARTHVSNHGSHHFTDHHRWRPWPRDGPPHMRNRRNPRSHHRAGVHVSQTGGRRHERKDRSDRKLACWQLLTAPGSAAGRRRAVRAISGCVRIVSGIGVVPLEDRRCCL